MFFAIEESIGLSGKFVPIFTRWNMPECVKVIENVICVRTLKDDVPTHL